MNTDLRFNTNFNFKIDIYVDLCLFVGFILNLNLKLRYDQLGVDKTPSISIDESFITSIANYGGVKVDN